jgi:hypothetical protein
MTIAVKMKASLAALLIPMLVAGATPALTDGSEDPGAVKEEAEKYFDKNGNPTFKVGSDGTVDFRPMRIPPLPH